jgi:nucleotide-binding universal stress UspA family protein
VTTPKTIVVGYDGGEPAGRALDRAIDEAHESGAHLVVIAVADLPLNPEGPQSFGALDDSPVRMVLDEPAELEPVLAGARERVESAGLAAEYVWAVGDPAGAIVAAARDHRANLIVVGSHHHSRLGRLLGSDVAAEVRRQAGCDLISVE